MRVSITYIEGAVVVRRIRNSVVWRITSHTTNNLITSLAISLSLGVDIKRRICAHVGRTDVIPEMGRVEDVNIQTLTPGQILNVFYDAPPTQPLEHPAQAAENLWATTATGFWDLVGTTNPRVP